MNPERTKVIACATVMEEMLPYMPPGMQSEILDFGLHRAPGRLKDHLQAAIDASIGCDTLLLGYGLCSLAVVGLQARNARLVIPRVDDCIAIFFGSRETYSQQARLEPGTYYLTKGWIEAGDSPFEDYDRLVAKYGRENADYVMYEMLKNYTRLVYIDTGQSENERYSEHARQTARKFNLRFEEVPGSNAMIRKLLSGPWDAEFVVAEPGQTLTYGDFSPEPVASDGDSQAGS